MNLFLDLCKPFFLFGTLEKKSACEINLCSFYYMSFERADFVDFFETDEIDFHSLVLSKASLKSLAVKVKSWLKSTH